MQVTTRDARFQQWQALLTNRNKRERSGEFLVQGVRPITLALRHRWPISTMLYDGTRALSPWAVAALDQTASAQRVAMAPHLLQELGGKEEAVPELLAVARRPPDNLDRIELNERFLGVLFDRPLSPGNIGTLVRSADAFSAAGVIVSGHAADPYDPKAIRASTGSLFAVPVVRVPSHREVLAWIRPPAAPARASVDIVGADENGEVDAWAHDFRGPTLLLVGSERTGLSAAWRAVCDRLVRIPMAGSASSLNAASSATVVLYEAFRQRTRGKRTT